MRGWNTERKPFSSSFRSCLISLSPSLGSLCGKYTRALLERKAGARRSIKLSHRSISCGAGAGILNPVPHQQLPPILLSFRPVHCSSRECVHNTVQQQQVRPAAALLGRVLPHTAPMNHFLIIYAPLQGDVRSLDRAPTFSRNNS